MESTQVVKELKSIKVLLYLTIICLLIVLFQPQLTSLYLNLTRGSSNNVEHHSLNTKPKVSTENRNLIKPQSHWSVEFVKDTFNKGNLDVVMEMCNYRIQEYPNDPQPYWYRAKTFRMLGKNNEALLDLDKMELLAPSWRKKYTDPLRKSILAEELKKRFDGVPPKDKKEIGKKLNEILKGYKESKAS